MARSFPSTAPSAGHPQGRCRQDPARVAIVIPIFRHPVLVADAIESALAQRAEGSIRILLVNDGCPFPETDQVCVEYAQAYPDCITYLRKPNGGLSAARNFGIRHVLAHFPHIEAIYLLDADNLLRPGAMARAMAELDAHPEADWIYPNIDMFGLGWNGDYGGPYSLLIHTVMNVCEAGSLIHRRVFEAGVFFDPAFRMGWEDWDFFLCAAARGFRGRNLEDFGFLYRKRPESMLAQSERDRAVLSRVMAQKHHALMRSPSLLRLEQEEAPRYAIHRGPEDMLSCVDPMVHGTQQSDTGSFITTYWQSCVAPSRYRVPAFTLTAQRDVLQTLSRCGLLHWALWMLERECGAGGMAALILEPAGPEGWSFARQSGAELPGWEARAAILAIGPDLRAAAVAPDPAQGRPLWPDAPAMAADLPAACILTLHLDLGREGAATGGAATAMLALLDRMRRAPGREAVGHDWQLRSKGLPWRGEEHRILRERFSGAAVFPRLADGNRHVGFLLPHGDNGALTQTATRMAHGLRAQGWIPHLFVLNGARIPALARQSFESINFLADPAFAGTGPARQAYSGTDLPDWAQSGHHGHALALLHWLDAVIDMEGGAIAGIMAQLRAAGITTVHAPQSETVTALGQPGGETYLGLAYEHAFDLFAPGSEQIGLLLHAMGVPQEKIVPVVLSEPGPEVGVSGGPELQEPDPGADGRSSAAALRPLARALSAQRG